MLSKQKLATSGGAQILRHYRNYPAVWNAKLYRRWLNEAEAIFRKVGV